MNQNLVIGLFMLLGHLICFVSFLFFLSTLKFVVLFAQWLSSNVQHIDFVMAVLF